MSDLIKVENISALEVFTSKEGVDPILKAITDEVKSFVPDMSTAKGRAEIASLAYKVAKSKTYLDDLGKALTEDWKKQAKVVDDSRKKIRDYLDNLKDEVRAPLTAWENKEKERLARHEANIKGIELLKIQYGASNDSATLKAAIESLDSNAADDSWEEFKDRAQKAKDESMKYLKDLLTNRQTYEYEQAELKRLREEAAAREQKEREERIAREAAEKAKAEAERVAREEANKAELKKQEELLKAKYESERIEREKQEAILKQKEAEEQARLSEERARQAAVKAEQEKKDAEKRAAEQERLRIQREKEKEAEEQAKREANVKHRKAINNEALTALAKVPGVDDVLGKKLIESIAKGEIPHIKIHY